MTVSRRNFIGSAAAATAIMSAADGDCVPCRTISQWQWRVGEVGQELEQMLKQVVARCDIGPCRGTVAVAPSQHDMFHVWVDMDDHKLAHSGLARIKDHWQMRSYGIVVSARSLLVYPEDELVDAMQKAMDAGRQRPRVRTWKQRFEPDRPEDMLDLTDYLVDWQDSKGLQGKADFDPTYDNFGSVFIGLEENAG